MTDPQLAGRICMVTGATDGMGKATARALAAKGAHVLVMGRNPDKGANVVSEIQQACGHERVDFLLCDLSSQQEIRALCEQANAAYPRLDVLVNNAGGVVEPRKETVDDIEMKSDYKIFDAYMQSKLANLMFTYELDRRLGDCDVTVNVLHPGWVGSAFGSGTGLGKRILFSIARWTFMKSPEHGAETAIHLASSPAVEGVSGKYFADCRAIESSAQSYDEANARRLWDVCSAMTR